MLRKPLVFVAATHARAKSAFVMPKVVRATTAVSVNALMTAVTHAATDRNAVFAELIGSAIGKI